MLESYESDSICNKSSNPALAKLKMLKEVETNTAKVTQRDIPLQNNIPAVFKLRFIPSPSGNLTNIAV